jgi:hypothetical protein
MSYVVQHDGVINGDLNVQSNNSLILQNTANSQSVSIKALSTLAGSYTLTLPPATGTAGQILTDSAGDGVLTWTSPSYTNAVGGTGAVQFADGAAFAGSSDFTWDGTSLQLADSKNFTVGTDDDLIITHSGTAGTITNSFGKLTIASSAASGGHVSIGQGSDSGATFIDMTDNSGGSLLRVSGDGGIIMGLANKGNMTFMNNRSLNFGAASYMSMVHSGTHATIQNSTGNLTIKNTNATGQILLDLGTNTNATSLRIRSSTNVNSFQFDGDGKFTATGTVEASTVTDGTATLTGGAVSGVSSLDMSADMTMSNNVALITHSGTTSLSIVSTSGIVGIEGVTFDGTEITSVSRVGGLSLPSNNTDAASKAYVDSIAGHGVSWKQSVLYASATSENFALSGVADTETIDGVALSTLSDSDRVLLKNQTTTSENAIYELVVPGTGGAGFVDFVLPSDISGAKASGTAVFVEHGSTNDNQGFVVTDVTGTDDFGSATSITWGQFTTSVTTAAGGTGAVQYATGTAFTGSSDFTWDGTSLQLADSKNFTVGTDDDLIITHSGTAGSITNAVGDLTIENTLVTGSTIVKLGTDTAATDFQIQNSSGAAKVTVDAVGDTSFASATSSTNTTSGALTVAGGVGVVENLHVGGYIETDHLVVTDKGSVTQLTSITTAVTLNTYAGKITTFDLGSIASHARASFVVNNDKCLASSIVLCNVIDFSGSTNRYLHCGVDNIAANQFEIVLMNSSGYTLDGTVVLAFMIV